MHNTCRGEDSLPAEMSAASIAARTSGAGSIRPPTGTEGHWLAPVTLLTAMGTTACAVYAMSTPGELAVAVGRPEDPGARLPAGKGASELCCCVLFWCCCKGGAGARAVTGSAGGDAVTSADCRKPLLSVLWMRAAGGLLRTDEAAGGASSGARGGLEVAAGVVKACGPWGYGFAGARGGGCAGYEGDGC